MADLLGFMSNNAGGFVTGTIVAVLQLAVVSLWIDRRVEKIQLKSEARRWKEARLELDASLLILASSLVRLLAYYLRDFRQGVYFRDNFSSCLHYVVEKSASLDATLAIYSIGLEPTSFTRITQSADHFRSVANYAAIALRNLDRIETEWVRQTKGAVPRIVALCAAQTDQQRRNVRHVQYRILETGYRDTAGDLLADRNQWRPVGPFP